MCGIVGLISNNKVDHEIVHRMAQSIRHRGPDDSGFYFEDNIGLGHARLSIIDLYNGKQPMYNEDESLVVVFNGEIFNYIELRNDLISLGHILKNKSDSEILTHMYEEYGYQMFKKLNGQFAIAIFDKNEKMLILARDAMGEKPLYYYHDPYNFCFASEIKAVLASKAVKADISKEGLNQVFTYWTPLHDYTVFDNIFTVLPGNYLVFKQNRIYQKAYYEFTFLNSSNEMNKTKEEYLEELEERLVDSVERRMRSDVPISFYLSGGLDSSLIAAIGNRMTDDKLKTFSLVFDNKKYDESLYQRIMVEHLNSEHCEVQFDSKDLPDLIREVIFHTEVPLLRTGAFPMYKLAKHVNSKNIKVALSGEGADELFGGYDIFKETKIKEFCNKQPNSKYRYLLYKRINNFVNGLNTQPASSLSLFYDSGNRDTNFSSHAPRWKFGTFMKQFLSKDFGEQLYKNNNENLLLDIMPKEYAQWTKVQKAQYLEISIFLSKYLLTSQGDRVSMASAVECRYPFLDHDILEYAANIPDNLKINVLNEKYLLKKLALKYLPEAIVNRQKFPYRAPLNVQIILQNQYIKDLLSNDAISKFKIFDTAAVQRYTNVIAKKKEASERDVMILMGILTTQILYDEFLNKR